MKNHVKQSLKRLSLSLLFIWASQSLSGQNNLTFYYMDSIPQQTGLNPGRMPTGKSYIGFPVISNFNAGFGSRGFQLDDLGAGLNAFGNDFDLGVLRQNADSQNSGNLGLNTDLFTFGMQIKNGYYSFTVSDYALGQVDFSNDFVNLAYNIDKEIYVPGQMFNLETLNFEGLHYRAFAFGYTRQIDDRLSIGGKLKYVTGQESIRTVNRNLYIANTLNIDQSYLGKLNQLNDLSALREIYENYTFPAIDEADALTVEGQFEIQAGGIRGYNSDTRAFPGPLFGSDNAGFAFDLGAVFRANPRWEFSASALNIGGIKWKKNLSYTMVNFAIDQPDEKIDEIFDELTAPEGEQPPAYRTALATQFFVGGRYFLNNRTNFGLLLNPYSFFGNWSMAYALSANTRIGSLLGVSASYSAFNNDYFNIGTGISLNLGPVQVFAITDNILYLLNGGSTNNAHLQFGLNLTFGRNTLLPSAVVQNEKNEKEPPALTEIEPEGNVATPILPEETITEPMNNDSTTVTPQNVPMVATQTSSEEFLLQGLARSGDTGEKFDHIYVDVFKILADGSVELVRTDRFPGAEFEIWLRRDERYMLMLNYDNNAYLEGLLNPANAQIIDGVLSQVFILDEYRPKPAEPTVTEPENGLIPKQTTEESTLSYAEQTETTGQTDGAAVSEEEATSSYPSSANENSEYGQESLGTYYLIQSTSLRREATHQSGVMLRFNSGNTVELLEKTNQYWWKVRFNGKIGWVKAAKLQEENF